MPTSARCPHLDTAELHWLLDSVPDTREMVVRDADDEADDMVRAAWVSARRDASEAWADWAARPSPSRWAVYVAAGDREDAAVAALALQTAG